MNILVKILKRHATVLLLISASLPGYAATSSTDISGNYTCVGTDTSDNSQYTVELTISKTGDIYQYKGVEKGIDNKGKTYLGTGLFAENSSTIFAAEFWQEDNPSNSGIIINQLQPDGGWKGIWSWRDKVGVNTETCKKK